MNRPTAARAGGLTMGGLTMGALAVALALALSGCGKKPTAVDSPGQTPFPQTYPNPGLDPKPGQPSSSGLKFP